MATLPAQHSNATHLPAQLRPIAFLRRAFCLWHLCSLDAPAVAVVWAGAFAWAAHARVPSWWWAAIACAVWAVYVGDRLMDATRRGTDLQPRHAFHWRWRRILAPAAAVAAALAGWLVLSRVPLPGLRRDSMVAAAALVYFSGVHAGPALPRWLKRLVSRECIVGVVFTAGCALPEWSARGFAQHWHTMTAVLGWPLVFFSALAWLNVRSITWWEAERSAGVRPFVAGLALAAAGAALSIMTAVSHPRAAVLLACGASSALLLAALDRVRVDQVVRRAAADFVLLTPILCLPFAAWVR